MNNSIGNNLNVANVGFCISESTGLYIVNNAILGLSASWYDGNYVIKLYIPNHDFIIYKHNNDTHNFEVISKKIIMQIMESIRYNITSNIYIDKIINEVIKHV